MNLYEVLATAFHEAGHGVIATTCHIPVRRIFVLPSPACRGHILTGVPFGKIDCEALILMTLAGPAAECEYFPLLRRWDAARGDACDLRHARLVLRAMHFPASAEVIASHLQRWRKRADNAVRQEWAWIHRVAIELAQWGQLSGHEIQRLKPSRDQRQASVVRGAAA